MNKLNELDQRMANVEGLTRGMQTYGQSYYKDYPLGYSSGFARSQPDSPYRKPVAPGFTQFHTLHTWDDLIAQGILHRVHVNVIQQNFAVLYPQYQQVSFEEFLAGLQQAMLDPRRMLTDTPRPEDTTWLSAFEILHKYYMSIQNLTTRPMMNMSDFGMGGTR